MAKLPEFERETRQRSLGCLSFSALAHVVTLGVLVLTTHHLPTPKVDGAGIDLTLDPKPEGRSQSSALASAALPSAQAATSNEVLLADSADPNAVALPAAKAQAPKVAKAKRASAPAPAMTAPANGDVEVQAALDQARAEQERPEPVKVAAADESPQQIRPYDPDDDGDDEDDTETVQAAPVTAPEAPGTARQGVVIQAPPAAHQETPQAAAAVVAAAPAATAVTAPVARKASAPANTVGLPTGVVSGAGRTGAPRTKGVGAQGTGSGGGVGAAAGFAGTKIRDASELVARPGNPAPHYPESDRLQSRQGLTVVVGRVKNDGSLTDVILERSSGSPTMDASALQTFKTWKFMPGQEGLVRKPFNFRLTGDAQEVPAQLRR